MRTRDIVKASLISSAVYWMFVLLMEVVAHIWDNRKELKAKFKKETGRKYTKVKDWKEVTED